MSPVEFTFLRAPRDALSLLESRLNCEKRVKLNSTEMRLRSTLTRKRTKTRKTREMMKTMKTNQGPLVPVNFLRCTPAPLIC